MGPFFKVGRITVTLVKAGMGCLIPCIAHDLLGEPGLFQWVLKATNPVLKLRAFSLVPGHILLLGAPADVWQMLGNLDKV